MERIPISEIHELIAAPSFADEDFLAEDSLEDVVLLRNISADVDLIAGLLPESGRYQKLKMPLWLGKHLQARKLCHMDPPFWFNDTWLKGRIAEEKNSANEGLTELPDHFMEIAAMLQTDEEDLRVAVEDLVSIRRTKILKSLKDNLDASTLSVNVTNFTAVERALLRPGATALLNKVQKLFQERTVASHSG